MFGWFKRLFSKKVSMGRKFNPSRIIVHCSASDYAHHDNMASVKEWHTSKGWRDIGYHFLITKDGAIHNGRTGIGAHCKDDGQNYVAYGVCLTGNEVFSEAQFASLRKLCVILGSHKDFEPEYLKTVFPHSHFANKACPNFNLEKALQGA